MPAPRLGCHLSLGLKPASQLAEARRHGVECMQIFASSPGAWKPPIEASERERTCRRSRTDFDIEPLFIHAIYLINLASADPVLVGRSARSLEATLGAGARLGASGVITHIGSHGGRGFEAVAGQASDALLDVLARTPENVDLILENSAGAGGIIGSTLEELAELINRAGNHPRLKIALDTAHLCGAGWDLTDEDAAVRLVDAVARTIGLDRLAVVHANDSKTAPGSHHDRHAVVGEGFIGLTGFHNLLDRPELRAVPWILETPDLDTRLDEGKRFRSLAVLQHLRGEQAEAGAGRISVPTPSQVSLPPAILERRIDA
ncbi:MAG TPA: deoxyribonuclease IV [Chloroflexota bacterium]